jgi:hypothetical protein
MIKQSREKPVRNRIEYLLKNWHVIGAGVSEFRRQNLNPR